MNTQARRRLIIRLFLITGMIFLIAIGLGLCGGPSEPGEALVFRSPDGAVSMATVNGESIDVHQVSDAAQDVECISTLSNGKCAWLLFPKDNSVIEEGWHKYGPLDVYIIRGDIKHIPQHNPYAVALSPNGDRLAYIAETDGGVKQILCCMDLRTGKTETITQEWLSLQEPTWSPDGTQIAYFGDLKLHLINMLLKKDTQKSESDLAVILNKSMIKNIIWSPDSKFLYFYAQPNSMSITADVATYEISALRNDPPRKIGNGPCYSISSDGKIVNLYGTDYRVDTGEDEPKPLPGRRPGSALPSPNADVITYRKFLNEGSGENENALVCKILKTGKEVVVSGTQWIALKHDWSEKWINLTASNTTPPSQSIPGLPGGSPSTSVQQVPPPSDPFKLSCDKLVLLAADMCRTGRNMGSVTQEEKNSLPKGWQTGLPLAINFLSKGVPEVIPFANWVMKIKMDPNTFHFSNNINIEEIRFACAGIEKTVGKSKAGAFRLAVMLTIDGNTKIFDIQYVADGVESITEEDRDALFTLFSKQKVNTETLYMIIVHTQQIPWMQPWIRDLAETQPDSAFGAMIMLSRSASNGDSAQVRKQLKRLSMAKDWEYVDQYAYSISETLIKKGMRKEAIQLLEIISDKGVGYLKTSAGIELSKLTGKSPKKPVGPDANDSTKWLDTAIMNQNLRRTTDALADAVKALETAKNPEEKVFAFQEIADINPGKALDLTPTLLPEFFHGAQDDNETRSILGNVGHALYTIANIDRSLSPRVSPFMERLAGHDIYTRHSLAKEQVLVNLWAGNIDEGLKNLSDVYNDSLEIFIGVIVRDGLSNTARLRVLQALKNYLATSNPKPKYVEQVIKNTHELYLDVDKRMKTKQWVSVYGDKLSPDGMKLLAPVLWRYVSSSSDPTPAALSLQALAGLPFPESLAKTGSPMGSIKPYPGAVLNGEPVKGSDPSGIYAIRTYTVATKAQKVIDYYKSQNMSSSSITINGTGDVAEFISSPAGYQVIIHIQAKDPNQTELKIKVYGER